MKLISISLILFLTFNPIRSVRFIPDFLSLQPNPQKIVVRELLLSLALAFLFAFIGEWLFTALNISQVTVRLSSGIIIFLAAMRILFPPRQYSPEPPAQEDPVLVPIAIPYVAGPSLLATTMLFSNLYPLLSLMLPALLLAWGATSLILFFNLPISRALGTPGLLACERLTAMLLVMLSIQRIMDGVQLFITQTSG